MGEEISVKRLINLEFGAEQQPIHAINGSLTVTIEDGSCICAMKPMGQDVTIASAKDVNGTAITALINTVIQQSDIFIYPLSEVIFTSITVGNQVTCYVKLLK